MLSNFSCTLLLFWLVTSLSCEPAIVVDTIRDLARLLRASSDDVNHLALPPHRSLSKQQPEGSFRIKIRTRQSFCHSKPCVNFPPPWDKAQSPCKARDALDTYLLPMSHLCLMRSFQPPGIHQPCPEHSSPRCRCGSFLSTFKCLLKGRLSTALSFSDPLV